MSRLFSLSLPLSLSLSLLSKLLTSVGSRRHLLIYLKLLDRWIFLALRANWIDSSFAEAIIYWGCSTIALTTPFNFFCFLSWEIQCFSNSLSLSCFHLSFMRSFFASQRPYRKKQGQETVFYFFGKVSGLAYMRSSITYSIKIGANTVHTHTHVHTWSLWRFPPFESSPPLYINPFLPDCKTTFFRIFYIFSMPFFLFLRPEHDCYAKFTSCST